MLKKLTALDLFLITFVLMYYGRLSIGAFVPQYAIDCGIPPSYYSLYFTTVSIGSAASNLLSIVLLRHVNPRMMFLAIGVVSAVYEVLLYLHPTPVSLLLSGLLMGMAAGTFWSLTFLMVCELIDTHNIPATEAFSKYSLVTVVMGALTPLVAGVIVQAFGYGLWILSALAFLAISTVAMAFVKNPIYDKTYGQRPFRKDLGQVLSNKRTLVTFVLIMLFTTFTMNTWSSLSRVFYAHVGIRSVWLGVLSIVVCGVTIVVYRLLTNVGPGSRRMIATVGILVFAAELLLIAFTSNPFLVFILEGTAGTVGVAAVSFATQNVLKNTFKEQVYIGRPVFALGMYVANAIWFAACGFFAAGFGGYDAVGQILGITVDQFGLRVLLLIIVAVAIVWAACMWKYEKRMVKDGTEVVDSLPQAEHSPRKTAPESPVLQAGALHDTPTAGYCTSPARIDRTDYHRYC